MRAEEKETLYAARYCSLTSFPASLDQRTELQCVDLSGNQLASLPESLENLVHQERGCLVYL
jgi:Leucine-rich repeat (LRR) protein